MASDPVAPVQNQSSLKFWEPPIIPLVPENTP